MPDDDTIANRIQTILSHLNETLKDANDTDLRVEIEHVELHMMPRKYRLQQYSATILREVKPAKPT